MGKSITFGQSDASHQALEGDLRLSAMISQEINLLLRDTSNLRNSPFISYAGSVNGLGSDTIRVRKAGLDGFDLFETPTNEGDEASTQDFTDAHVDIAVARLALMYKITDLASMTGFGGADIDPFRLAQSMAGSYEASFADKTADAIDDFTNIVGSAATQMSVDDFFNAIFQLEKAASNKGAMAPFAAILHPVALTELQDSLRNETGNAISYMSATQEMLQAKGPGYVGNLLGVDVYKSSYVNDSAGAYLSAMFGVGALAYADGVPASLPGAAQSMAMGKVLVEMERDGAKAITSIIGHAYLGLSVIDDDRGVLIKSTT
jgi:hypothetical protein